MILSFSKRARYVRCYKENLKKPWALRRVQMIDSSKLNFSDIHKSLKEECYANIPFPIEESTLESAIEAFFKFLDEPEDIKNHIDFTIAPLHRRGDVGFKHREPGDHIYNDRKDFFHFHPALLERYADFLDQNPVVKDFVLKAHPIWQEAYQTVTDILSTFEPTFPGVCGKIFDTDLVHFQLRFLKYYWQESGYYLAKPHFDAGSFTLAISESGPGLRIGRSPETLKPVEHRPGNAVFMLSSNFQKVMDTTELSAGWHDVIQVDKTLVGKPFARWAIVAFIEGHGVEALPRTETHKWYTEQVA